MCPTALGRKEKKLYNVHIVQCAGGGGGLEKVPILKQLLHFSGQSDGGEW